jgi:hypothetical protein
VFVGGLYADLGRLDDVVMNFEGSGNSLGPAVKFTPKCNPTACQSYFSGSVEKVNK